MADNQNTIDSSAVAHTAASEFIVEALDAAGGFTSATSVKVSFTDMSGSRVHVRIPSDRLANCEVRADSVVFLDPTGAAPPMRIRCLNEAVASSFSRSLRILTTDNATASRHACVLAFDAEGYQVPVESENDGAKTVEPTAGISQAPVALDVSLGAFKNTIKRFLQMPILIVALIGVGVSLGFYFMAGQSGEVATQDVAQSTEDESNFVQDQPLSSDEQKLFDVAAGFADMSDEEFEQKILAIAGDQSESGFNKALHMTALREFGKKVASGEVSLNDLPLPSDPMFQAKPQPQASGAQPVVIQLSTTGEGAPIHVFADPQCPACQHYETTLEAEIGKRPINILPVAILKGSDFVVDQILCSESPIAAWKQYMKDKTLVERDLSQCPMLFAHQRNNDLFNSMGLTQTPSSLFESIPGVAIVGSVIPAEEEAKHQQNKK